jgi:hypothetical protein
MENGLTVFLNLKDAYLPKAWKHYEGLICLYGGGINESDTLEPGSNIKLNLARVPDGPAIYKLKALSAIKRELTEETGTWWIDAKVKGTKLQLINTCISEEDTIFLYTLEVDPGVMSFKALQGSNTEGMPLPMTYQRFLRTNEHDYVPGIYDMVKQVFDKEKM